MLRQLLARIADEARQRGWEEWRVCLPVAERNLAGFAKAGDPFERDGQLLQMWRGFL